MAVQVMPFHPTQSPAVLSASMIGTWQWNIPDDRVHCDQTNAGLLGLTVDEAAKGVPILRIVEAIHPDDREAFRVTTAPARAQGGSVSLIVRTTPAPDMVRRVIVRGHYAPDTGYGRGVLIDVTDLASGVLREGSTVPFIELEDAIDTCLTLRNNLGPHASQMTHLILDMLLLDLGKQISASLKSAKH